jgi:hypothetical protein
VFVSKPALAANLPPVITSQPTNVTVAIGESASFQVSVTSLSTLSYLWRKNGIAISNAISSSFAITNVQPGDAGNYSVKVSNAGGSVISSNAILTVLPNTAPVLDPSKHPVLADEYENSGVPSGPVGTLVSQLVDFAIPTGQLDNVTDPDSGALLGIAITTADTSHGSWWFSTNDGTMWNALGAASDLGASLLAADARTRIYFYPATNWNGVLTNAITFRAWDQTAGTNGGTSASLPSGNMLDKFDTFAYTNSDGSASWDGSWVDIDGSASSGSILVQAIGQLAVRANSANDWIYRQANLAGVSSATVSFDYQSDLNEGSGGLIYFQVSRDGGSNYTTLAAFSTTNNIGTGTFTADITPYASSNTCIRFMIAAKSNPTKQLTVDNVQIAFISSAVSGVGPFSQAKESASLTVIPVNHPPVANNQSVTTAGGWAKLITLTASDMNNDPLTFSIVSGPTNGLLSNFNATNGTVLYTPIPSFAGVDTFTFLANDGTTNSAPATVTITVTPVPPGIATQPQPQAVTVGQSVWFSVAANGSAPFSYQWSRNGAPLPGATSSTLWLTNAQSANAGSYSVVVTNLAGSAASAAATLKVAPAAPTFGATQMTPNGFKLQLSVITGFTYVISASTDMRTWTPISTNLALSPSMMVTDSAATNFPGRYYRAMGMAQ